MSNIDYTVPIEYWGKLPPLKIGNKVGEFYTIKSAQSDGNCFYDTISNLVLKRNPFMTKEVVREKMQEFFKQKIENDDLLEDIKQLKNMTFDKHEQVRVKVNEFFKESGYRYPKVDANKKEFIVKYISVSRNKCLVYNSMIEDVSNVLEICIAYYYSNKWMYVGNKESCNSIHLMHITNLGTIAQPQLYFEPVSFNRIGYDRNRQRRDTIYKNIIKPSIQKLINNEENNARQKANIDNLIEASRKNIEEIERQRKAKAYKEKKNQARQKQFKNSVKVVSDVGKTIGDTAVSMAKATGSAVTDAAKATGSAVTGAAKATGSAVTGAAKAFEKAYEDAQKSRRFGTLKNMRSKISNNNVRKKITDADLQKASEKQENTTNWTKRMKRMKELIVMGETNAFDISKNITTYNNKKKKYNESRETRKKELLDLANEHGYSIKNKTGMNKAILSENTTTTFKGKLEGKIKNSYKNSLKKQGVTVNLNSKNLNELKEIKEKINAVKKQTTIPKNFILDTTKEVKDLVQEIKKIELVKEIKKLNATFATTNNNERNAHNSFMSNIDKKNIDTLKSALERMKYPTPKHVKLSVLKTDRIQKGTDVNNMLMILKTAVTDAKLPRDVGKFTDESLEKVVEGGPAKANQKLRQIELYKLVNDLNIKEIENALKNEIETVIITEENTKKFIRKLNILKQQEEFASKLLKLKDKFKDGISEQEINNASLSDVLTDELMKKMRYKFLKLYIDEKTEHTKKFQNHFYLKNRFSKAFDNDKLKEFSTNKSTFNLGFKNITNTHKQLDEQGVRFSELITQRRQGNGTILPYNNNELKEASVSDEKKSRLVHNFEKYRLIQAEDKTNNYTVEEKKLAAKNEQSKSVFINKIKKEKNRKGKVDSSEKTMTKSLEELFTDKNIMQQYSDLFRGEIEKAKENKDNTKKIKEFINLLRKGKYQPASKNELSNILQQYKTNPVIAKAKMNTMVLQRNDAIQRREIELQRLRKRISNDNNRKQLYNNNKIKKAALTNNGTLEMKQNMKRVINNDNNNSSVVNERFYDLQELRNQKIKVGNPRMKLFTNEKIQEASRTKAKFESMKMMLNKVKDVKNEKNEKNEKCPKGSSISDIASMNAMMSDKEISGIVPEIMALNKQYRVYQENILENISNINKLKMISL